MTAKFAVALIATSMFVAPALAADAVNSAAPAAPAVSTAAPASTPAASTNAASKPAAGTGTKSKEHKAERSRVYHTTVAHNGKSHVRTVTVTRSVKVVKSNQSAWPFGPFTWTAPGKSERTIKVVHHHAHHIMVAHKDKPSGEAKTVLGAKPIKTEPKSGAKPEAKPEVKKIAQTPASGASTSDVKVIKADKNLKNGSKPGKTDTTQGQAGPGAAPAGTSNKDANKAN